MSDNVITDLAIPAGTGIVAKGLTETLVAGTRWGAQKTGDAIADALQKDGEKTLAFAVGCTTAFIAYLLMHRKHDAPQPVAVVAQPAHDGKVEAAVAQQRNAGEDFKTWYLNPAMNNTFIR